MAYKLRCSMFGHSSDVRCVSAAQELIVSGSRDTKVKLWSPIDFENGYKENICLQGHSNFVTAVCVMPPSDVHPKGIVFTGSSDNSICAFHLDNSEPIYKLLGHNNTVCALTVGKFGTVVSGSWDSTAKVWLNQKCLMTLDGHTGSVWAVALISQSGLTLTGSADKTIKMWRAGKCERTFTGHIDCVRALAVISENSFLSASNDCTIRRWSLSGVCDATYAGHENFVYSLVVLSSSNLSFASVGEDCSLRVWRDEDCKQVIRIPAQTVWSVTALSNGDLVTGSSDGVVRIFTSDPNRQASAEELSSFADDVSKSTLANGKIGDFRISDLPGNEVLYEPGTRDGQTKLIRNGGKVEVFQWSVDESKWVKIGDALGSAEGSTSGKVTYQGKEYDYVFDVDIEEGMPALKLPYNVTEDPWFAAQKFLETNDISQLYLDQVANFIMKNTKGIAINSQPQSEFQDPFTGQSRYKPVSSSNSQPIAGGADPFTGSGRYIPQQTQEASANTSSNKYFPLKSVLTFDAANKDAIKDKLKEFSNQQDLKAYNISENIINDVLNLINSPNDCSDAQEEVIKKLLEWPDNFIFPVLDVLRLIIRNESVNRRFCSGSNGQTLILALMSHIKRFNANSSANCILSLKIISNMSCQDAGGALVLQHRDPIFEIVNQLMPCENKAVQIACTTVLLNYSVLLKHLNETEKEEMGSRCLLTIAPWFQAELDREAQFRSLVALGTLLLVGDENIAIARSLDIVNFLSKFENVNDPKKISDCASEISRLLR